MTDIEETLCKEIDAILDENMGRLEKSVEHIQLSHDPECFTRYEYDEKDGVYSNRRRVPYKNHMRNIRNLDFKVTLHGKIND